MKTTWQEAIADVAPLAPVTENMTCDVCVIGGGIAGITTAYFLSKGGKKVVVIDKGTLADSVTAYTTAFLTSVIDTDLSDLIHMYGKEQSKKIIASHEKAIDVIEQVVREEGIDCEFKRVSSYQIAMSEKGFDQFKKDAVIANQLGYEYIVLPDKRFPFACAGVVENPQQAKFHPLKYLKQLREKAEKQGAVFYERTKAIHIDDEGPIYVKLASGHVITATDVVVATYNPFTQPWWYVFKKGMYVSYIYEIEIEKGMLPEAIYEDDHNPYFYFRIDPGESKDRMIIGGADHRKELSISDERGFHALDAYLKGKLGITSYEIKHKWSGPILEQTDGLAYIGRMKEGNEHVYVPTAFSGNGMTYGTLSGMIIGDQILGKNNEFEDIYRPGRPITFQDVARKGRDYIDEFFEGMGELFGPKR